ncbi:PREDICTED: heparanase-like [Papilio xuthus]|uniref:Heparanase-like n=1 Tax=Papilio xuthus TaxID=66420 RepID=A0AAJ6ZV01_PAPXU|nr:PREDICTED: heparanase-like [Papilio xuthus]
MVFGKRIAFLCAIAVLCDIGLFLFFVGYNSRFDCYVTIDEHQEIDIILPDNFLSIGIDASELQDYHKVDFGKLRFQKLATALQPARLRIGGTMSDRLIFSPKDNPHFSCNECASNISKVECHAIKKMCKNKEQPFFVLTGKKWSEINEFCNATGIKLLFALNLLLRDNHEWNSDNAVELFEYSSQRGYKVDWQLGNEPNSLHHIFHVTVTPKMLAHDFKKLRHVLDQHGYNNSLLVGPDTTRPQPNCHNCLQYMIDFLDNGSDVINVRSWHQYYLNSRTAKLEDFWDPKTFDLLNDQIITMKNNTMNYNNIPMWLTETSSSYGGGAPGLSNSYAGSPLWLDKLGLCAKHNITTVIRQSFFGGNYSLVDNKLEPLPDWWVSILYKKLVGNKVLHVDCNCTPMQRMYAHCTNRKYTNDTTAITIYAINLELVKARFFLNGTAIKGKNLDIDEFVISTPSNNRNTKTVLLNGWPLFYENSMPDLDPHHIRYGTIISLPPYSIGFWVVKNTLIKKCE